jgi:hypothetical protein
MDFNNLPTHEQQMIRSAYNTVCTMDKTDFLKTYNPPADKGFMCDDNDTVIQIMNKIHDENGCHSGASLAYTLRWIQYILRNDLIIN